MRISDWSSDVCSSDLGVLSPSEKGIMNISASQEAPIVLIVDDDEDVRIALSELMLSVGIEAACFGSTAELLQSPHLDRAGCLVLDVRMPGPSGLDLQQHLAEADRKSTRLNSSH